MAVALVIPQSMQPAGPNLVTLAFQVATDSGLVLNGTFNVNFANNIATNLANLKTAAQSVVAAYPGAPAITTVVVMGAPG